jgi:hypothetical protein
MYTLAFGDIFDCQQHERFPGVLAQHPSRVQEHGSGTKGLKVVYNLEILKTRLPG